MASGKQGAFMLAVLPQMIALLGLNVAGVDLLFRFQSLNRAWLAADLNASSKDDPSGWITHAGPVGPPITVLTWGVILGLIRVHMCLFRRSKRDKSWLWLKRHLILDIAGLAIPAVSLAALLPNGWLRSTALDSRRIQPAFNPVDFIPALYLDGMGETTHGYFALLAGGVGALCLYEPLLALVVSLVARLERRVHISVLMTFCVLVLLGYLVLVILIIMGILQGLACALTDRWGCGPTLLDKMYAPSKKGIFDVVAMVMSLLILLPAFTILGIVLMPVAALWYSLRGWVFRTTDVTRSCFFVPCIEPSASGQGWGQFLVVAGSCGLVAYHVYLVGKDWRQSDSSEGVVGVRVNSKMASGERVWKRVWKRRNAVVSLD